MVLALGKLTSPVYLQCGFRCATILLAFFGQRMGLWSFMCLDGERRGARCKPEIIRLGNDA